MTPPLRPNDRRYITDVILMNTNGDVAVFDQFGRQMLEYQGNWRDKRDQILEANDGRVDLSHIDLEYG